MHDLLRPYYNIPQELRELHQWHVWRYEDIGAAKPDKVPYNARTGKYFNVNDPDTYSTFEECLGVRFEYSGIGFCFTDNDPYTFIDLDDPSGDPTNLERQLKIFREFDSYAERSPSKTGLHIIIKGKFDGKGRKRSKIELYCRSRYATMTGDVYHDAPIREYQDKLTMLYEQMGAGSPATIQYNGNAIETATDQVIIAQAKAAVNGDKFDLLYKGHWQDIYQSQSEADLAFINIIAFYTQNETQITRIFRQSPLGARPKAKRNDYVNWMIKKSFDQMLPPIDIDGFKVAMERFQQGSIAQLVEPKAHNFYDEGSNPSTTTNRLGNGYTGRLAPLSSNLEVKQSRTLAGSTYINQQKEMDEKSGLAQQIQIDPQMRAMPGESSSYIRFSSQGPNTERLQNFEHGINEPSAHNGRNQQVHGSLRQLSQETSLHRSSEIHLERQVGVNSTIPLPQGLMGEIAQFIYASSPRQVPEIAIAGAIGLMAGICGKAYNISGTGLNQYVILIAQTGAGKETMASGIDKLMNSVKLQVPTSAGFLGPAEIASGQALIKYINTHPCFVSILGEFGIRLQSISNPHANGSEKNLLRVLLDLYNKSGHHQSFRPSIYSDKEKNISETRAPAFTILAESTPETFYNVLNEDMVSAGLLPRFLIIEYKGKVPYLNENAINVEPSFQLVERFASLAAQCEMIMHSNRVININADANADKLLRDFQRFATDKVNANDKDFIRQLWNRAHMKALKISALIAVGVNLADPVVTAEYVQWAMELVSNDIRLLSNRFEQGEIGAATGELKQLEEMKRMIKLYYTDEDTVKKYKIPQKMYDDKILTGQYLNRRLVAQAAFKNDKMGSTVAIKRCIQTLVDSDTIREIGKGELGSKYGTTQKSYVLVDLSLLN